MGILIRDDKGFQELLRERPLLLPSLFLLVGLLCLMNNYSNEAQQLSSVSESGVLNSAGIFVNEKAGFSITPPPGWKMAHGSMLEELEMIRSFGEILGRE